MPKIDVTKTDEVAPMEFLAGVPKEKVLAQLKTAPCNEVAPEQLSHSESSAALCVNAFGWFLDRPERLPPLGTADATRWQVERVTLEAKVRFPWSGGRHPCLDVLIRTVAAYIGVESKRYEPYRGKPNAGFSQTYWRDVWGPAMNGYQAQRDGLRDGLVQYQHLDASQLIKHALGLRSATARLNEENATQRTPRLVYLYATPRAWPTGTKIAEAEHRAHEEEIERFAEAVAEDEVRFEALTYRTLLEQWRRSTDADVRAHAKAVAKVFTP